MGNKRKKHVKDKLKKKLRKLEREIRHLSSSSDSESSSSSDEQSVITENSENEEVNETINHIDEELIAILGADPLEPKILGEEIHAEIANRWQLFFTKGIAKEDRKQLLEKYPPLKNCTLCPPLLNAEVKECISEALIKQDTYLQRIQEQMASAMSALGTVTNILFSNPSDDTNTHLSKLVDAAKLFCDIQHSLSSHRRFIITPQLNPAIKKIIDDYPADSLLLGEKFQEKIKERQEMKKTTLTLNIARAKPTNNLVSNKYLNSKSQFPRAKLKKEGGEKRTYYQAPTPRHYRQPNARQSRAEPEERKNQQSRRRFQWDILKLFNSTTSKKEKSLNRILLKHETVECTCPDIIIETVNKNIRYRPLHGPKKNTNDTLAPSRLFVIYDRIEVVDSVEIPQYTSIDKPAYQVKLENSNKKGFVRLKYIDPDKPARSNTGPSEPRTEPPQSRTEPPESRTESPEPRIEPPEPIPSTSKDPDPEIYEYNTIYQLRTPKPLKVSRLSEKTDTLPETCFTSSEVMISQVQFAEMKMKNEGKNVEIKREDYFETVVHIDALGFMNYFKDGLFPNSLGRSLGFTDLEIDKAKSIPGMIFCNLTEDEDNLLPCEVIPSVSIPWPEEQTYEFMNREDRPTITDRRSGIIYRWPTENMLNEIKAMNCVAIPTGYWLKKGQSPDSSIKWEIAFPKAERYLEARMSHPQIKCYMLLLVLLKTYIEPETKQHGLLPEHIRCHMYWECEANYMEWPEHMLGRKIKKVLSNLINHLATGELPDYFIRSKNLFENIPKKYLHFAQRQFHLIVLSPSMYFLKALRNIQCTSNAFYTPFDFMKLYKILTQPQGPPKKVDRRFHGAWNQSSKPIKYNDRDLQIRHETELENRAEVLRKREQIKEEEKQKNRKESIDSIDLEWVCKKEQENYDSRLILTLFIECFIQLADDSSKMGAHIQAKIYLKQAFYLSTILERISPVFREEASEFKETIQQLEQSINKKAVKEVIDVPPMTPIRNSGQFDFSTSAQQLRSNTVDRENLGKTFASSDTKVKFAPVPGASKTPKGGVQRVKSMERGVRKSVSFMPPK